MYICLCQGITEEQIKNVAGHSNNVNDALKKLGVGESCGVCLIEALNRCGLSSQSATQPHTPKSQQLNTHKPTK